MTDAVPTPLFGYALPTSAGDYVHYQFYKLAPSDALLLSYTPGYRDFNTPGPEAFAEKVRRGVDFLAERDAARITQGGLIDVAVFGRARGLALLDEARARTGIPVSSVLEDCVDALRAVSARSIVIAASWSQDAARAVQAYLADAGIVTVGMLNEPAGPAGVPVGPTEGVDIVFARGRRALSEHARADALLLGDEKWPTLHAVRPLEAASGRPVVTYPAASIWAALKQFGRPAVPGFGRLLDQLKA